MNYYKRVNVLNTNEVYIGRTQGSILARNHRDWASFHDGKLSKHLMSVYADLYKNGKDFHVELLESSDNSESFDEREQFWINHHIEIGNTLLNATTVSNVNTSKSIVISSYNLDGSLHKTYKSKLNACLELGINNTNLEKALTGVTRKTAGFMWRVGEEQEITGFDDRFRCRTVYQFDTEGNFINEYPNMTAAARAAGLKSAASIHYVITGKHPRAAGFIWSLTKHDNIKI